MMHYFYKIIPALALFVWLDVGGAEFPSAYPASGDIHRDAAGRIVATPAQTILGKSADGSVNHSVQDRNNDFEFNPTRTAGMLGLITSVMFESENNSLRTYIPVTFGQVFAKGDVMAADSLEGKLIDGRLIALQVDIKALHGDGSIRHAVISAILPRLQAGTPLVLGIVKKSKAVFANSGAAVNADPLAMPPGPISVQASTSASPDILLSTGFDCSVKIMINGQSFHANAAPLLKKGAFKTWLAGPLVNEWLVTAPLMSDSSGSHPHLAARFYIRSYTGMDSTKVDVVLENDWVYAKSPQNYTYDVQIAIAGTAVYSKQQLVHYHHARWHKVFWRGTQPELNIAHNSAYLIATKAVANYDQNIKFAPSVLNEYRDKLKGANFEPMGSGLATQYMPTTGGRGDIGLMPAWTVGYLLSMNSAAKSAMLGTADSGGSWSVHFRDPKTDRPVSLVDYPYMTILGHDGDTYNPKTKKLELFPRCELDCKTPLTADVPHQPDFAYLPYIVTGDYFYLEELQFWTMVALFQSNPGYRENIKGLLNSDQVRGQAWGLRNLANAAYITPDADILKKQFETFLSNNLDWYNTTYSFNHVPKNTLGTMTEGRPHLKGTALTPWQDDFFTSAVGHAVDLGFDKAKPLLLWKVRFPIKRLTDPAYCWIFGAAYDFVITDKEGGAAYTDMLKPYLAANPPSITSLPCASPEMASALKLKVGEMTGSSNYALGFPSNMQPALAYAATSGVEGGEKAWDIFMARSVKPDYSQFPEFAIIPRR